MPFSSYQDKVLPADLDTMQRVFDIVCKERRIALKDREQREDLEAQIVAEFDRGVRDEAGLLRAVSRRRRYTGG